MKAIIMAGGEGSRLRPLTCSIPKPMVPVMNKPVMQHIIELLKLYGITEIGVTLQYMPKSICDYFKDGKEFGVNIEYFIENTPLGTAGSVKNAEKFLDGPFVVISGDALTDINLKKAIDYHNDKNSMATLVLTRVDVPLEYGVVVTDSNGKIKRFLEKPGWSEVFSDTVNTGIYILNPEVLSYINPGEVYDFGKDLFPFLLKNNKPMFGYTMAEYWCDIGDLNAYSQCHFDILKNKVNIEHDAKPIEHDIFTAQNVTIEDGVRLKGPLYIGSNTTVGAFANIESYSVIGENCNITENASIEHTILWNNVSVGRNSTLTGCLVCDKAQIKQNCRISEQAVIGEGSILEDNVWVKQGIKIWPSKVVEDGTELSTNLILGTKHSKTLFANSGVQGEINLDITPEFASKLGAAFSALCKSQKPSKIAVSSDNGMPPVMLKNSVIAGLLSSGSEVYDFGEQLLPVTRSAVKFYGLDGGIHIMTNIIKPDKFLIDNHHSGGSKLSIEFLGKDGLNITRDEERKLSSIFSREEFMRVAAKKIKTVVPMDNYKTYYVRSMINEVKIKPAGFNVMLYVPNEQIRTFAIFILNEIGCNVKLMYENPQFFNPSHIKTQVMLSHSDLGIAIDENCERIMFVDETGRVVDEDLFLALVALITLKSSGTKSIKLVVPLDAPSVIDVLARRYNGTVVRTKTSNTDVMKTMNNLRTEENSIEDQFVLNFDVIGAMVKIINFMKQSNVKLSNLLDDIPDFYMVKNEVNCPFSAKSRIIRHIIEENEPGLELTEGVKIRKEGGWVLVIPDSQRPVCKVIAEGFSEEYAKEISNVYINKINKII